jgi:hypothetical protein
VIWCPKGWKSRVCRQRDVRRSADKDTEYKLDALLFRAHFRHPVPHASLARNVLYLLQPSNVYIAGNPLCFSWCELAADITINVTRIEIWASFWRHPQRVIVLLPEIKFKPIVRFFPSLGAAICQCVISLLNWLWDSMVPGMVTRAESADVSVRTTNKEGGG